MCEEEGLLTSFLKFHEDHATSTIFSQRYYNTYCTGFVDNLPGQTCLDILFYSLDLHGLAVKSDRFQRQIALISIAC